MKTVSVRNASNEASNVESNKVRVAESRARRNAIGCSLLFTFCILLTRPVLEMGINDDPSYIHTALEFARTGHLLYNGWAAPILGWQIVWGALFIKLFGFSFTLVRLSMLPIAIAAVYLFHQILVRFGLNAWNAVVGTLVLALSPLFLALTPTFMTDISGLFCILLCLHLCQRALLATSDRSATMWLCAAAFSNIIGGTVRQTAWLGVLILVPCTAWLLRRRRGMLQTGILLWLVGAVAIFLCIHWFHQQPYSIPEKLLPDSRLHVLSFGGTLVEMLLSVILFCLPVFIAFVPALSRVPRILLLWCGGSTVAFLAVSPVIFRHFHSLNSFLLAPYLGYVVTPMGLFRLVADDTIGLQPRVLPISVRLAIGILVILATLSFCLFGYKGARRSDVDEPIAGSLTWHQLLTLILPLTLVYTALLLPRASSLDAYDRYLLLVCVSVLILVLRFYQEVVQPHMPPISVAVLAVFALWGIAATHDYFTMNRARLAVAEQIGRAGVPRTRTQAGFEYDYWTQIEAAGYLNNKRIEVPKGAYHAPSASRVPLYPDLSWYTDCTPAIDPKYVIVFSRQSNLEHTDFVPISYRTFLPPFGGTIYVERVSSPAAH